MKKKLATIILLAMSALFIPSAATAQNYDTGQLGTPVCDPSYQSCMQMSSIPACAMAVMDADGYGYLFSLDAIPAMYSDMWALFEALLNFFGI